MLFVDLFIFFILQIYSQSWAICSYVSITHRLCRFIQSYNISLKTRQTNLVVYLRLIISRNDFDIKSRNRYPFTREQKNPCGALCNIFYSICFISGFESPIFVQDEHLIICRKILILFMYVSTSRKHEKKKNKNSYLAKHVQSISDLMIYQLQGQSRCQLL